MFNKKTDTFSPKTMRTHIDHDGYGEDNIVTIDSYKSFFEEIQAQFYRNGPLQVTFQDHGIIKVSTLETTSNDLIDERTDEVKKLLENHLKGKAFPMKAHAVLVHGSLKGVFPEPIQATLKKKKLIKKGILEELIVIKDIDIGSFEDFI